MSTLSDRHALGGPALRNRIVMAPLARSGTAAGCTDYPMHGGAPALA